jgi:hypothetical protein
MDYSGWGNAVSARWPPRDEPVARREWEALKLRLAIGVRVTGIVRGVPSRSA